MIALRISGLNGNGATTKETKFCYTFSSLISTLKEVGSVSNGQSHLANLSRSILSHIIVSVTSHIINYTVAR